MVEGNIPDGVHASPSGNCARCWASRSTPLREALKVLAAEGLMELLPNRGARVRQLERARSGRAVRRHGRAGERWPGALLAKTLATRRSPRSSGCTMRCTATTCNSDMHGYFQRQPAHPQKHRRGRGQRDAARAAYASFAGRIRRVRYAANFARKRRALGRGDARARGHPGGAAPPRRQRTALTSCSGICATSAAAAVEYLTAGGSAAAEPG